MQTTTVDIPTPDGVADAFLVRPDGEPRPGVLFLMDIVGLRPTIASMMERIAADGYTVLAPNLLYRAGRAPVVPPPDLSDPDPEVIPKYMGAVMPLAQALTPERIASDGAAFLDALAEYSDSAPSVITGYCLGGFAGWWISATSPDRVAALGSFHPGGLVNETPQSAHLVADQIKAELYLAFADEDQSMPAEAIATIEGALDQAGASYRSEVYSGARHGFTMSDNPLAYDQEAAERHFRELSALLQRTFA